MPGGAIIVINHRMHEDDLAGRKGRKPSIDQAQVEKLRAEGLGATEIAQRLNIGRASVCRVLASHDRRSGTIPGQGIAVDSPTTIHPRPQLHRHCIRWYVVQHRPLFRPDIVQYFRVPFPDEC
jgi:Helix-turn-helix domain of resolvase